MDNYDEYFRMAKMLTDIHAKKKIIQKDNNNDESNKEKNEKMKNKDNNKDVPNNSCNNKDNNCDNNINVNEEKQNEENCDNDIEGEDVEMKIKNFSEKKLEKINQRRKMKMSIMKQKYPKKKIK